jgi:hypothetical protein
VAAGFGGQPGAELVVDLAEAERETAGVQPDHHWCERVRTDVPVGAQPDRSAIGLVRFFEDPSAVPISVA